MRSSIKPSALLMSSTTSNAVKGFSLAKIRASIWGIIELKFNLQNLKMNKIIGSKICLQTTLWLRISIILNYETTVLGIPASKYILFGLLIEQYFANKNYAKGY